MAADLRRKRAEMKKKKGGDGPNVEIVGLADLDDDEDDYKLDEDDPNSNSIVVEGEAGAVYVSAKDQQKIIKRRELEEKKKEEEYQQNYDEYQQYLRQIERMLDVSPAMQGSFPHGSNNP